MLNSNNTCRIETVSGFNVHGEPTFSAPVTERCAVVKLLRILAKTTVRADSSSSRGHGDEKLSESKILLQGETIADLGDRLTVLSVTLKVVSLVPRQDVSGYIDHYEATCEQWA